MLFHAPVAPMVARCRIIAAAMTLHPRVGIHGTLLILILAEIGKEPDRACRISEPTVRGSFWFKFFGIRLSGPSPPGVLHFRTEELLFGEALRQIVLLEPGKSKRQGLGMEAVNLRVLQCVTLTQRAPERIKGGRLFVQETCPAIL